MAAGERRSGGLTRLGLPGAAVATLVSEAISLAAFYGFWRFAPAMAGLRRAVRLHRAGFAQQSREGVPMGLQYLAEGGALAVAGVLIGLLGATALAANQIVFSGASVLYLLPLGMAGAVGIRTGQVSGGGESARVRPIGLAPMGLVTLLTLMFTAALVIGGEDIAAAFVDDHVVVGVATAMFIAVGAMPVSAAPAADSRLRAGAGPPR